MGQVEPERLANFVKVEALQMLHDQLVPRLGLADRVLRGQISISAGISYSVSVAVAKTVLAGRLLRLMDPTRQSRRSVLKQIFVSLVVLQVAEEVFVQLFSCQPTRGSALLNLGGTCLQQRPMWFTGVSTDRDPWTEWQRRRSDALLRYTEQMNV